MNTKEDKATRYVQDKMFPNIVNATRMNDKTCFTKQDLKQAYEKGYEEGFSDGKIESLEKQIKKNKDEQDYLSSQKKLEEAWNEMKKAFNIFDKIKF